ncbi:MAG TPA: tetratricopeptide repeat protein, partial [Chloroflexi bacterium]|nr:tetratricopeptide repeat protein [Chloroflexota bacterium]
MTEEWPARDELDEPFAQRVERLKQELALALRWDRPAILLTVYRSAFVRADAERALEAWLREQGQATARVEVRAPDDPAADLPRALAAQAERAGGRTVFFVSGLAQGAPTTWNSLNVRREYLVEGRVRAVFWLTEGEAAVLPWQAPDFWSFRHRSVEFIEPPEMGRAAEQAGQLAWEGFRERLPPGERRARIRLRGDLLAELPATPETAPTRAELHYTLGGLRYWERDYEPAGEHFRAALELAEQLGNTELQTWAFNGLGNVYSALGRHDEALAAYRRAVELDPDYATPHNGLGNVYSDLGRHDEAIAAYHRAVELDPEDAYPHNGLGTVYAALGRYDDAVAAFQRAIQLDPDDAPHNGLGNVYRDLGRHDEAIAAYRRAVELDPEDAYPHNGLGNVYSDLGRHEEALAAYRRAVELDPALAH